MSVSTQRDAEQADIARERRQLAADPRLEQAELTDIYVQRGLDRALAATVAERLMATDPLAAMSGTSLACNRAGWRDRCRRRSSRR